VARRGLIVSAVTVFNGVKNVADFRYAGTCHLECVTDIRHLA